MSHRLRIVDAVFARPPRRAVRRSILAVVAAAGVHTGAGYWASHSRHAEAPVAIEQVVELEPPPPEKKPPDPPPPKPAAEPAPTAMIVPQHRQVAARPQPAQTPAQAGKTVALDPDPNAPVDMGDVIVQGEGRSPGGPSSENGKGKHPVDTRDLDHRPPGPPPGPPRPDRSSPLALEDEDWTCPWPHEADAQEIDEQVAVVTVDVRADGSPERARITADPGFGFGPAAVACAMHTRYHAAHDRDGRAIHASAAVKVTFTR